MLVNDDQIIPYGYDSTMSISRSLPSDLQETAVEGVEVINETDSATGVSNPVGCSILNRQIKKTKYTVKNNSAERTIKKFYIDHNADVSHNGYVITTNEHSIKSVMGFSRFEFKMDPLASLEFIVREEVTYETKLTATSDMVNLINRRAPGLMEQKILKQEVLDVLKQVVRRSEADAALVAIENERFSERELLHWSTGSSVDQGGPVLDKNVLSKVKEIIDMKGMIAENKRKIDYNKKLIDKVFVNQGRLRENIKSLEKAKVANSDLMKRYLSDLEKDEDFLKKTRAAIENIEQETVSLEKSIVQKKRAIVVLVKNMKGQLANVQDIELAEEKEEMERKKFEAIRSVMDREERKEKERYVEKEEKMDRRPQRQERMRNTDDYSGGEEEMENDCDDDAESDEDVTPDEKD